MTHDLGWAVAHRTAGSAVWRACWESEDELVIDNDGYGTVPRRATMDRNYKMMEARPLTLMDIFATDWCIKRSYGP